MEQSVEAQEEVENPAGSKKSSAKVTEDAEKLVKKLVPSTLEKFEAQKPSYDEKPIISYPQSVTPQKYPSIFFIYNIFYYMFRV